MSKTKSWWLSQTPPLRLQKNLDILLYFEITLFGLLWPQWPSLLTFMHKIQVELKREWNVISDAKQSICDMQSKGSSLHLLCFPTYTRSLELTCSSKIQIPTCRNLNSQIFYYTTAPWPSTTSPFCFISTPVMS